MLNMVFIVFGNTLVPSLIVNAPKLSGFNTKWQPNRVTDIKNAGIRIVQTFFG